MGSVTNALPKEHMKKFLKAMKAKKGFTLVEIMAVVALIAILFVIFIPRIGFAANKTKMVGVQVDMHSYQTALETTAMEHGGFNSVLENAKGAAAVATPQEKADALAAAVNSNLDKSLGLTAGATDAAPFTTDAGHKDPWGNAYAVAFTTANNTFTITSGGPDGAKTVGDDLVMTCAYDGTCKTATTGFSVDMK